MGDLGKSKLHGSLDGQDQWDDLSRRDTSKLGRHADPQESRCDKHANEVVRRQAWCGAIGMTREMRWLDGGVFRMGSDRYYPEERPERRVRVSGFWIDPHPVTNTEFAEFVDATGYRTL